MAPNSNLPQNLPSIISQKHIWGIRTLMFCISFESEVYDFLQARLSERNIVELVNKIQELGLLESKLLHSIHGKEYITPEHLCLEVRSQVETAGGRLAIVSKILIPLITEIFCLLVCRGCN